MAVNEWMGNCWQQHSTHGMRLRKGACGYAHTLFSAADCRSLVSISVTRRDIGIEPYTPICYIRAFVALATAVLAVLDASLFAPLFPGSFFTSTLEPVADLQASLAFNATVHPELSATT